MASPYTVAYMFPDAKSVGSVSAFRTKPMAKTDVDLIVTYCGVCHTDVHFIDNDWGMSRYPLVPGHEIVGHVTRVGTEVKELKVGDQVAMGCVAQSCYKCECCQKGRDNLCADRRFTYFHDTTDETGTHRHMGGFSSFMRTDYRKLYKVPRGLEQNHVGPLMCAGVTVFEPIRNLLGDSLDGKGKTIGVLGIGGLGHLALQFVSKTGATAVAFSRGKKKEEFTKFLGASYLVDTTNADAMQAAYGTLDQLIVCTSGGTFECDKFLPLVKPFGNMHLCGIPDAPITFTAQLLVFSRISISGNPTGGSTDTKLMLEFAAKHGIEPIIEEFPHSKAHEAIQKIRDGTIRFRAVLKNDLVDVEETLTALNNGYVKL
ncbi:Mannitol dehydrogenase (Fragment) [Seminavis robusta]|uniref:Mannitol dehydrogenase n=1 Tax=Seminavis robusta TaxID=568900 RepID=A0A9N8HPK3_9STRA